MAMEFQVLDSTQHPVIDLADEQGRLKIVPARDYDAFDRMSVRLWCLRHARYGLPTTELIEWLQPHIEGKVAIEIGSGTGDLARALGIPATDNRMQEWPFIVDLFQKMRCPVIQYPEEVEALDALAAVERYRPEVVIASWVTEWIDPDQPPPPQGGNVYGVKETELLATGVKYILIGNEAVHGRKRIMSFGHQVYRLPFLCSRASQPDLDRVYIWAPRG